MGSTDATIKLLISPGFHVNANPATFPYLIPTELTAGKVEELIVGKPIYPSAEKKKFQFADKPLAVYEGEVQIRLPLRTEDILSDTEVSVPISVRVQACDNEKCYAPDVLKTWISVHWKYCCDD
ncbi:MAG TPA: protein-disulfide reductase DsbD domain-containing protein [Pyrinomonadaceae bacterium]|nr:protein-disulfide reductase DsbD domain-containing protein [Pyrinomonadaceae bacterium]